MALYKRTIYLVNPKFQIKFSFFVTSLVFICSLIYPIVIYETYNRLIAQTSNAELAQSLIDSKSDILQLLILFQLIFVALVFVICIFQSHKIAGPLYKLRKHFGLLQEGESQEKLSFRKGDHFRELAEDYNLAVDAINRSFKKKNQSIEKLNKYLLTNLANANGEEKKIYHDILERLSDIKNS